MTDKTEYQGCSQSVSCSVEGCTVSETGVCGMHNVEVERRQNLDRRLGDAQKMFTDINEDVAERRRILDHRMEEIQQMFAETNKTVATLVGSFNVSWKIAVILISASFMYSTIIWNKTTRGQEALSASVVENSTNVGSLIAHTSTSQKNQDRTFEKMDQLSESINQLVTLKKENVKIKESTSVDWRGF